MFDWIHLSIPPAPALFAQLLVGLINGAFYALLSLGLAVIFGLLNIINFAHGAQYMLGAFCAWFLLNALGLGYWPALVLAPLIVGVVGIAIERLLLRHIYRLDPLYGLLLTFGLALIIEGIFRQQYGSSGQPYAIPPELRGARNLGFMFLPNYRAWVISPRSRCAWRLGSRSSARGSAPIFGRRRKTRSWSRLSASTCRG